MTPVRIACHVGLSDTEGVRMVLVEAVAASRPRRVRLETAPAAAGRGGQARTAVDAHRPWPRLASFLLLLVIAAGSGWQWQVGLASMAEAWLPWLQAATLKGMPAQVDGSGTTPATTPETNQAPDGTPVGTPATTAVTTSATTSASAPVAALPANGPAGPGALPPAVADSAAKAQVPATGMAASALLVVPPAGRN